MDNIREASYTYKLDFGVVDIDWGFEVVGIVTVSGLVGTMRGIVVVGKVVGSGIVKGIVCNMANWVGGAMGCLSCSTYPLPQCSQ